VSPIRALPRGFATALTVAGFISAAAARDEPLRATGAEERATAERRILIVRLDPRSGGRPGECESLDARDVQVMIGGMRRPAEVTAVERVPRPERHWLLVDISESAEDRRQAALQSALQYVRSVMSPGEDVAALLTVDEDPILIEGPTTDPRALEATIEQVRPGGWSALRDGLDTVLRQVQGDRHEHVILYWTDGEDQASTLRPDDLLATLDRTPNATVFPICLLPNAAKFPPPPLTGATFTEVARRSGGEVFISSDPRWLERVRGWLGRRFTVSFIPPPELEGAGGKRKTVISLPGKRCEVTILNDPFAAPDPIAGEAPPAPGSWSKLHAKMTNADDAACATRKGSAAWAWTLTADATSLSGCVLDVTQSNGPIVRDHDGRPDYVFQAPRFAAREIRVRAPSLAELPSDPATAIAALLADEAGPSDTVSPFFMDGSAFLAQRAQIAASLFASRPDFHEFALARLRTFAEGEVAAIARDFAQAFPTLSPAEIDLVARSSRAGARSLESAARPTDADLARVLSAWIDDVPAADLLRDVERQLIDARIGSFDDPDADPLWEAALARFAVPSRIRIEAPLALIRDPEQDVVGFVRVVLPRPEEFRKPNLRLPRPPAGPGARIVKRPLALGLVAEVADDARIGAALVDGGYRASSIDYKALSLPFKHDPGRPYEEARVRVVLEGRDVAGAGASRIVLEADVSASERGPVTVARLTPTVTGDPALAALLTGFRATPLP